MDPTTIVGLAVSLIVGLGGGTGLAGLLRWRADARKLRSDAIVAERSQLSTEQVQFRLDMSNRLTTVTTQLDSLRSQYEKTLVEATAQGKDIAALSATVAELRTRNRELTVEIAELHAENRRLSEHFNAVVDEKAALIQQLQVAEAKFTFIQNENNALRTENERLKSVVPLRTEIVDVSTSTGTDS